MEKFLKSIWGKLYLLISGMTMTLLMMGNNTTIYIIISLVIAFGFYLYWIIKHDYLQDEFLKYPKFKWISLVLSILWCYYLLKAYGSIYDWKNQVIGVLSLGMIFLIVHIFVQWMKDMFLTSIEGYRIKKRYVFIGAFFIWILIWVIFSKTSVFYIPFNGTDYVSINVIYTTDSGWLLSEDVFMNINATQNDLRQPLFGVFSVIFALIAKIVWGLSLYTKNIYWVTLNTIQIMLLIYAVFLVAKMATNKKKEILLFMLMFMLSFPFLLYSLVMEQYIFSTVWLIVYVYMSVGNQRYKSITLIASTGSMLTSGVLFPIVSDKRDMKEWLNDILRVGIKALGLITVLGQLSKFLKEVQELTWISRYTGKSVLFIDRIYQFSDFVEACFIAPQTIIGGGEWKAIILSDPRGMNIAGITLFIFVILGFILNKKEKIAQVSFAWVIYSFIILCVIGWGTAENGLVLYTLYFSWAYMALAFMGINKLLGKKSKLKYCVYGIVIVIFTIINIASVLDIIQFGIEYYPVS